MQLRVLFLARLREVTGMREIMLDVPDGSVAALRNALELQLTGTVVDSLFAQNTRLARNQSLWDGHTAFMAGDEIAFLPPVTGG